jgi:hypothetical protein
MFSIEFLRVIWIRKLSTQGWTKKEIGANLTFNLQLRDYAPTLMI